MTEPGDEELIQAIVRRDPAALVALYDRHRRVAFALAYRVLDDAGAAEEAVQDAFLQVWQRAASFDAARGGAVRPWLLAIVRNRSIDLRRRKLGRPGEAYPVDVAELPLAVPDVWGEVHQRLERDRVRSAIASLPDDQQQAIELAYFEGLTHREIAERTGAPLGTVKGRLRLGLQKLAGALAERGAAR